MEKTTNLFGHIRRLARRKLKPHVISVLNQLGVLDKDQTNNYLRRYRLTSTSESQVLLPTVSDAADSTKVLFYESPVRNSPNYVWRIDEPRNATLLRCGALLLHYKLLRTDYTADAFINLFTRSKRQPYQAKTLIAPWSQYFELNPTSATYRGWIRFGGYYDFMMLLASKLCRIKDAIPEDVFAQSVIAYPLLNTTYEREVLALLGFRPDQILDSRLYTVSFDTCLLGDSGSWCYPNVTDLLSLKRHIEECVPIQRTDQNRIYIRRAGRRRIIDEKALIELVERYDFTIIEDIPRSIAEQVSIYKNATFILGPHGASFTNIIWCEPGTHLFELFNPAYIPNYYLYLSQVLGLRYSAYCHGTTVRTDKDALMDDIIISISDIEKTLQRVLEPDPIPSNMQYTP